MLHTLSRKARLKLKDILSHICPAKMHGLPGTKDALRALPVHGLLQQILSERRDALGTAQIRWVNKEDVEIGTALVRKNPLQIRVSLCQIIGQASNS